jgi:hypothetical protein
MEAGFAAIVAVSGTLLGSALTYLLQRRTAEHASSLAAGERGRQERLDAYAAFAGAAVRYRAAALDRWHRRDEDPSSDRYLAAKAAFYQSRADLIDVQLRMQLVTVDVRLHGRAAEVVALCDEIKEAMPAPDREVRAERARAALRQFVSEASQGLARDQHH